MHCLGQCQLMKKLEQEDKKDQSNPQRNIENNNKYFLSQEPSFSELLILDRDKQEFNTFPDLKVINRPHSIFKPPMV